MLKIKDEKNQTEKKNCFDDPCQIYKDPSFAELEKQKFKGKILNDRLWQDKQGIKKIKELKSLKELCVVKKGQELQGVVLGYLFLLQNNKQNRINKLNILNFKLCARGQREESGIMKRCNSDDYLFIVTIN